MLVFFDLFACFVLPLFPSHSASSSFHSPHSSPLCHVIPRALRALCSIALTLPTPQAMVRAWDLTRLHAAPRPAPVRLRPSLLSLLSLSLSPLSLPSLHRLPPLFRPRAPCRPTHVETVQGHFHAEQPPPHALASSQCSVALARLLLRQPSLKRIYLTEFLSSPLLLLYYLSPTLPIDAASASTAAATDADAAPLRRYRSAVPPFCSVPTTSPNSLGFCCSSEIEPVILSPSVGRHWHRIWWFHRQNSMCWPYAWMGWRGAVSLPSNLFSLVLLVFSFAQYNLSRKEERLLGSPEGMVLDPRSRKVAIGSVTMALAGDGKTLLSLSFLPDRVFQQLSWRSLLPRSFGYALPTPVNLLDSFRSDLVWRQGGTSKNGIGLGLWNLPVQVVPPESIGAGGRICDSRLNGECILVYLGDSSIADWGAQTGAAVLGPDVSLPPDSPSSSVRGFFSPGSARPIVDVGDVLQEKNVLRAQKAEQLLSDAVPALAVSRGENKAMWNWVFNTVSFAIKLFETNKATSNAGRNYLFVVPISEHNAQSVVLLCLVLAILDATYFSYRGSPLKTTLDDASFSVFSRLSVFHSLFSQCFDTHGVVSFLDIHLRAMEVTHSHSGYQITGRARQAGSRAQINAVKVARCPCALTEEDKALAAVWMTRPTVLPHDYAHNMTTEAGEEEEAEAFPQEDVKAPEQEQERVAVWDPSSYSPPVVPPSPSSIPLPPSPPAFQNLYISTSPSPISPPFSNLRTPPPLSLSPAPYISFASPLSPLAVVPEESARVPLPALGDSLLFLDYDVPSSDFLAHLDQLQKIEAARKRVDDNLKSLVEEAAKRGVVIQYSFV